MPEERHEEIRLLQLVMQRQEVHQYRRQKHENAGTCIAPALFSPYTAVLVVLDAFQQEVGCKHDGIPRPVLNWTRDRPAALRLYSISVSEYSQPTEAFLSKPGATSSDSDGSKTRSAGPSPGCFSFGDLNPALWTSGVRRGKTVSQQQRRGKAVFNVIAAMPA